MTLPHHILQSALSEVGIEKPSDVTLVLERAREMMNARDNFHTEMAEFGRDAFKSEKLTRIIDRYVEGRISEEAVQGKYTDLITAASTLVEEIKAMGEASDRKLPGSYDELVSALEKVKG